MLDGNGAPASRRVEALTLRWWVKGLDHEFSPVQKTFGCSKRSNQASVKSNNSWNSEDIVGEFD
jgi:hypothetical protein